MSTLRRPSAAILTVLAVLAFAFALTGPARADTSPRIGVGVGGCYIGDTVTDQRYYGTQCDAVPGNTPVAAGTSHSFSIYFTNAGNVEETVTFGQQGALWLGYTPVPAAWISSTFPASVVLEPGQRIDGSVTVTVPDGAAGGEYTGLFQGLASAPGSGNVKLVAGAAEREYITVP